MLINTSHEGWKQEEVLMFAGKCFKIDLYVLQIILASTSVASLGLTTPALFLVEQVILGVEWMS